MIKWLLKYGLVIFIINNVLLSIEYTYFIGNQIFIGLMVLFAVLLLLNSKQIKNVIFHKAFSFFLIINLLNIFYFLFFHSIYDISAIKYLFARFVQFSIISLSIYYNYDYYRGKFLDHIVYFVILIIILSFIFYPNIFSARYSGIIWNPNMLSSIVTIAFAILFLKNKKYSQIEYVTLFLLLLVSIATGSRGSLVAIVIAYFVKHGTSKRNVLYFLIASCLCLIFLNLPFETSINRFSSQSIFNDRILQYKYAIASIYKNLYTGYGLDKYSFIDMSLVPWHLKSIVKGAHNGYFAILTQYGIVFGSIIILIILQKSIQLINFFKYSVKIERTHLFIIIYALFASFYESLLTGINEFHTTLFWFSIAFLSITRFKKYYDN